MFPSLYNAIPLSDELYIRKNCPSTARIRKKRIFQLSHKPFTRRNSIKAKRYGICVCSKPREKNERKTLFRNRKIPSASVMNTIQMRIRRRRLIYDECGGRADRQASCQLPHKLGHISKTGSARRKVFQRRGVEVGCWNWHCFWCVDVVVVVFCASCCKWFPW